MDAAEAFLSRVGIPLEGGDRNLSLALGSMAHGVTPLQLAGAYAAFANDGVYRAPYLIERIVSGDGETLYRHADQPARVTTVQNAYLLTSLMNSVVTSGTGTRLREAGVPIAAKTGTVSMDTGNRDIWTAAYTHEYALAVWMGFDSTTGSRRIPSGTTGGSYPASLANAFFKKIYQHRESAGFSVPDGLTWLTLDTQASRETGDVLLAGDLTPGAYRQGEVFLAGNRPTRVSTYWDAPAPPSDLTLSYDALGNPTLSFSATAYGRFRLEREENGTILTLLEQAAQAGDAFSYTDETAAPGATYVYRVVPSSERLLAEGVTEEGASVSLLAQSRRREPTWLERLFGEAIEPAADAQQKSAPEAMDDASDARIADNMNLFAGLGW